uniref:2'-phosphotransferase n=1 Tax=Noctiluca scintillans TaxID=2966 RepID=A0A7S1AYK5_NOCSC|mmetsp:Transcript_64594/g.171007  ORF Transcript_64594/g.171007 Transcript_64594/m.171007 type:complete len:380 (+) Transcript_64594:47-1186(+)
MSVKSLLRRARFDEARQFQVLGCLVGVSTVPWIPWMPGILPEHLVGLSRTLARLLRHSGVGEGLHIDRDGFCRTDEIKYHIGGVSDADLMAVVNESFSWNQPRFQTKECNGEVLIRATHKHSKGGHHGKGDGKHALSGHLPHGRLQRRSGASQLSARGRPSPRNGATQGRSGQAPDGFGGGAPPQLHKASPPVLPKPAPPTFSAPDGFGGAAPPQLHTASPPALRQADGVHSSAPPTCSDWGSYENALAQWQDGPRDPWHNGLSGSSSSRPQPTSSSTDAVQALEEQYEALDHVGKDSREGCRGDGVPLNQNQRLSMPKRRVWTKYLMPEGQEWWWCCEEASEDYFLEAEPVPWCAYIDDDNKAFWHHAETDEWFYQEP